MPTPRTGPLGVLSATGSMLYRDANGNVTDVVPGVDGQVLTLVSGIPAWAGASYIQASDTTDQTPGVTTPVAVTMNTTDASAGISQAAGVVTVTSAGIYFVIAAGQVGETAPSNLYVDLWLRKNGGDLANSNTRAFVTAVTDTFILVVQAVVALAAGDTIQVFQSVSVTGKGAGLHTFAIAGEPTIPSMLFTMFRVGG